MAAPSLTIFAIPRAFTSSVGENQKNAIRSWLALPGKPEIFLCGDDEGVKEACEEFGIIHIPDIRKNEFGTYYLADAFSKAKEKSTRGYICYANADIIFTDAFASAIKAIEKSEAAAKGLPFLAIGQRWDFDAEPENIPKIRSAEWDLKLAEYAAANGKMHPPWGSDFFLYPRSTEIDMPDFVVGRPYWDNWMIYFFRRNDIPVIDITRHSLAYHQNHDYSHVAGSGMSNTGPEADANRKVIDEASPAGMRMNLLDASYVLTKDGVVKKNLSAHAIWRRFRFLLPVRALFFCARFVLGPAGASIRLGTAALVVAAVFAYFALNYGQREFAIFYAAILYLALMQIYIYFQTRKAIENEGIKTRRQIRKMDVCR